MVGEGVGQQPEPLAKQMLRLVCQEVQRWVGENFPEIEPGDKPVRVVAEADETTLPVVNNLYVHQSHVVERIYDGLSTEDQRSRHEGVREVVLDMLDSLKTVERQSTQTSQFYLFGDKSAVSVVKEPYRSEGQLMPLVQALSWQQPILRVGEEQLPTNFNLYRLGYHLNTFANDKTVYRHVDDTMPVLVLSRVPGVEYLTVFNSGQPPIIISTPNVKQGRGQLVDLRQPQISITLNPVKEPAPVPESKIEVGNTRYPTTLLAQAIDQFNLQLTSEDAKRLLNGQKIEVIVTGDGSTGKLYVLNTPDQGPQLVLQDVRRELTLKETYLGHAFTDKDKQNLLKYGDMGRAVDLIDKQTGQKFTGFVGVDKDTKTLTVLRADQIRPKIERMSHLKGVSLTGLQKQRLMEGKAIRLDNMTSKAGTSFSAYVRVSAAGRTLRFDHIPTSQAQKPNSEVKEAPSNVPDAAEPDKSKRKTRPVGPKPKP